MTSMYQQKKKKRAVDPNAPPRPTLLGHEKVIKDVNSAIKKLESDVLVLRQRLEDTENLLRNQTAYLNSLHQLLRNHAR